MRARIFNNSNIKKEYNYKSNKTKSVKNDFYGNTHGNAK